LIVINKEGLHLYQCCSLLLQGAITNDFCRKFIVTYSVLSALHFGSYIGMWICLYKANTVSSDVLVLMLFLTDKENSFTACVIAAVVMFVWQINTLSLSRLKASSAIHMIPNQT